MTEESNKEDLDLKKDQLTQEEMEEGELIEEGEIMDDDDQKPVTEQRRQEQQHQNSSPLQSSSVIATTTAVQQHPTPTTGRDFNHRGTISGTSGGGGSGSSTWRKSFGGGGTDAGGHHPFRRGSATGKYMPRGGDLGTGAGRYRGNYDAHTTTKQDEQVLDSWVRGAYRKGGARTGGGNSPRGDISPIRTSPMIEMSPPSSTSLSTIVAPTIGVGAVQDEHRQSTTPLQLQQPSKSPAVPTIVKEETKEELPPIKQEITEAATQSQLEDDRDFRMAAAAAAAAAADTSATCTENVKLELRNEPEEEDDNDYRRHHQQQPMEPSSKTATSAYGDQGETAKMIQQRRQHHSPPQSFGGPCENINMRRRPHSSSPPSQNTFVDEQRRGNDDDFYGPSSAAKRQRSYYDETGQQGPPSQGSDGPFTPNNNFEGNSGQFHGNVSGSWSSGHGRGGFHNQRGGFGRGGDHHFGDDDGGGGGPPPGRTQGFGYRGGRPFFPRLICKFFREGYCRDGEQCTFSHATADSHRRPDLCKFYQQGFCKKNLFCQMMHGEWPCKAFHKGECSKEQCMFSHQPLDDVSGPIFDKMLEQERLGLSNGPGLHHGPIQHTPQGPGGFYRPRFQQQHSGTPQQPHPQQQHQYYQHPHPQQIQQQQQQGPPIMPMEQQQRPQTFQQQQPLPVNVNPEAFAIAPAQQSRMEHPQQQISMMGGDEHKIDYSGPTPTTGPNIPPPALVLPPMLVQQQQQPQANAGPYGFFNRTGSGIGGPVLNQSMQMQPPLSGGIAVANFPQQGQPPQMNPSKQPTFQQLQQQVQQHQQLGFSHFPHQPSLLGPSAANTTPPMSRLTPQQFDKSPIKQELFAGNHVDVPQVSPPQQQQQIKEEKPTTGGFNINQMLEQITKQKQEEERSTPPQTISTANADTALDLFASVGLGSVEGLNTTVLEESPASPTDIGNQEQPNNSKVANIPVVREWKLHPVDIPTIESPNVHFDIKLVQQISSSNSDPRLRKLAEKQFDLVSKTLEQQQANQKGGTQSNGKTGTITTGISALNEGSSRIVMDPRKDPRRKTLPNKEAVGISSSPSTMADSSNACNNSSSLLPSSSSFVTCQTQSQLHHQTGYNSPAEELPTGYGYNGNKNSTGMFINTNNRSEENINNSRNETELVEQQMAAMFSAQQTQPQQFPFAAQMAFPPPFQQPLASGLLVTTIAQALNGIVTGTTTAVPSSNYLQTPPPLFAQAQRLPAPAISVPFFGTPPPQPFINMPTPQIQPAQCQQQNTQQFQQQTNDTTVPPLQSQQQFGMPAFDTGGFGGGEASTMKTTQSGGGYRGRRGEGRQQQYHHRPQTQHHNSNLPKQQQQSDSSKLQEEQPLPMSSPPTMVLSLREKRKNNEYESPLARIASGSSSSTGADRY